MEFTIKHFCKDVKYSVDGFVMKNMDNVSGNMKKTLQKSGLKIVRMMFPTDEDTTNKK